MHDYVSSPRLNLWSHGGRQPLATGGGGGVIVVVVVGHGVPNSSPLTILVMEGKERQRNVILLADNRLVLPRRVTNYPNGGIGVETFSVDCWEVKIELYE